MLDLGGLIVESRKGRNFFGGCRTRTHGVGRRDHEGRASVDEGERGVESLIKLLFSAVASAIGRL